MGQGLFDLSGKVAVVTGGGTGLGRGMAFGLAQAGAYVVLTGRREAVVKQTAGEIRAAGGKAEGVAMDLTRIRELPGFFDGIARRLGRLDVLVNNAGTNRRASCLEYGEEDWDTVMTINLKAVFFACQAAARIMKAQGGGKIINTASLASAVTAMNQSAYAPSKAGVKQITMALALELAPYRINVNAIGPGWFRTPLNDDLFRNEVWAKGVRALIPWGRTGTPEDLAGAAVFLASAASDYLTGQVIYVDGGMLAGYRVHPIAEES
ncbi:MAG TPA: glucose 1-dehydrogenase [Candidatus Sulfotelmatobacter sp.]|nr:glucose 1-dehydrogenase [Candidatus Sulfotelmatobacter sp.]